MQLLGFTDDTLTLWSIIKGAGILSAFAIPAWAAWVANFMAGYAPLSWVSVGIVGFLMVSIGRLSWAKSGQMIQTAKFRQRISDGGGIVNPLEKTFTNKRIRVADLSPPIGAIIHHKTFVDCEIIGPCKYYFF